MSKNNPTQPHKAKYFKISERLWLFISIAALIWATTIAFTDNPKASVNYFIVSSIAVLYYFVKRFFRIRVERQYEEQSKK